MAFEIKDRLKNVLAQIEKAALACGRNPEEIRLVAVSKTKPVEKVLEAIDAGVTILGENFVQEAENKVQALSSYPVSWHFIGHLQRNKAKYAVRLFELIHSVDSLKLAQELDKQAKKLNKTQKILIQVNIASESTKSGATTEETLQLIWDISRLENLSVRGLMTLPPFFDDPESVRPYFIELAKLREHVSSQSIPNVAMDDLSMGMTGDFKVAIACGATLVRIGTAIFGRRN
jgi:pyridoxal phosphate enzyme (YggS family)